MRQEWLDAPDLAAQRAICDRIQRRAFETIPQLPLGRVFPPAAFRDNVRDIVRAPYPVFWGLRKT